ATDFSKRKKLKSRNGAVTSSVSTTEMTETASPVNPTGSEKIGKGSRSYSKDHLDSWLENCLRDATNSHLSSSSEFLDFTPHGGSMTKQTSLNQAEAHHQKKQHAIPVRSLLHGMNPGPSFNLGIQRHPYSLSHRYPMLFPPQSFNEYGIGYSGDSGQEFASLPPLGGGGCVVGGEPSSEHDPNSTDVDGSGRCFRFSDPCLLNPSDNDSKLSGQNTPEQNKFFTALMEQIKLLHDTNSRICQNLQETKVDIEALKHAPFGQPWAPPGFMGMRHRRDSLSELSTQSQPVFLGGALGGTHSPAPTFHSGAYTPGMMTDVVREVKEAARVREDAMLSRVKSIVEERQWALNEGNVRVLRDIDELKSHVTQLRLERKETNKRLTHLEAENKYLRQALASCYSQRQSYQDTIYENDRPRGSRKPFPNGSGAVTRRAQSFNLHYGTINQTPAQATHALEEEVVDGEDQLQEKTDFDGDGQSDVTNKRLSCSSNESRSNRQPTPSGNLGLEPPLVGANSSLRNPPGFALVSEKDGSLPPPLLPRKKEHAQMKKELSEAAAARKEANHRIIALEKLVKDLGTQVAQVASPATAPATKFSVADGPITDL
ncbi:hypothetical protein KR018_006284, partial [Drosophila ironensis]